MVGLPIYGFFFVVDAVDYKKQILRISQKGSCVMHSIDHFNQSRQCVSNYVNTNLSAWKQSIQVILCTGQYFHIAHDRPDLGTLFNHTMPISWCLLTVFFMAYAA